MRKLSPHFLVAIWSMACFVPVLHADSDSHKPNKFVFPPSFAYRSEGSVDGTAGESFPLDDNGLAISLIWPTGWTPPASGEVPLTIHFHNPESFAATEHARRGLKGPLIIAHLGPTMPVYQAPFKDKERFGRWIKLAEAKLKEKGAPEKTRIVAVDISSYGAGYGAVREILGSPEYVKIIRRLVLCDSMYASYAKTDSGVSTGVPSQGQIEPWVTFAREAVKGDKTFVMTYSQITPPTYASTGECAAAIMSAVGGSISKVELDSSRAANDLNCTLLARGDTGNFHAWGYSGNDVVSRMMHPWHLADIWKVLDGAGEP